MIRTNKILTETIKEMLLLEGAKDVKDAEMEGLTMHMYNNGATCDVPPCPHAGMPASADQDLDSCTSMSTDIQAYFARYRPLRPDEKSEPVS